jgi:isoleucyl-tRNA synthetase
LQADIVGRYNDQRKVFEGGHFGVYEFHPVVAQLQIFCSEDLGAFYLDVLKDRLYTTQTQSHARRSAQTALWHITQAMLRWMAPFLSFTAEEAWAVAGKGESIFAETYSKLPKPDDGLLTKWTRIRELREAVNKEIEVLRSQGQVGSYLQAQVSLRVSDADHALLQSLGQDLRFVFITSAVDFAVGDAPLAKVSPSTHTKCDRCWHYRADVGQDAKHTTLCSRCICNLHGAGETRLFA